MPESFMDRFRKGLERTRDILNADVEDLVRGRRPLKPEDLDAIEEGLIAADLGLPATQRDHAVHPGDPAEDWPAEYLHLAGSGDGPRRKGDDEDRVGAAE